MQHVTIVKFYT